MIAIEWYSGNVDNEDAVHTSVLFDTKPYIKYEQVPRDVCRGHPYRTYIFFVSVRSDDPSLSLHIHI